jgi:DNA-binding CsgD family transcriptional regulator
VDDSISTGRTLGGRTSLYVRRLLVERVYIYAKLYNPGGSVILRNTAMVDHDRPLGYSTEIGNSFHLDLIDLQVEFERLVADDGLSKKELNAMLTWADGMTSREAADYLHARGPVSVQKLRERGMRKLQDRIDDTEQG